MVGGERDRGSGAWIITDCERNRLQLEALQGRDPWAALRTPTGLAGRRPELKAHQRRLIGSGLAKRCGIWAAEQGTGKTLAAFEVIEALGGRGWWIGLPGVLPDTRNQAHRWALTNHPERWLSCYSLQSFLETYSGPAPEWIVFDECTILKGCGAIYKAVSHLVKAMRVEHGAKAAVFLLSGKPAPHEPTDWWAPAELVAPGLLRESSPADLRRRLAVIDDSEGYPVVKSWRMDEVEKLGRRLAPVVTVIRAKDCLDLPECEIEVVDLPIDPETLQAAKLIAGTAESGLRALELLRQFSDGFQYMANGAVRCPTPKDDFLREKLRATAEDGRIAIYAPYRESIDRIVEVCKEEGWNVCRRDGRGYDPDPPPLSEFDASTSTGQGKWAFVAHFRSGGLGLNLTAPRVQVLYSLNFDWGAYDQTIKRLHRLGQTRGVKIYVLAHLKTDRYVFGKLEAREELQNVTLDEVRRVLG